MFTKQLVALRVEWGSLKSCFNLLCNCNLIAGVDSLVGFPPSAPTNHFPECVILNWKADSHPKVSQNASQTLWIMHYTEFFKKKARGSFDVSLGFSSYYGVFVSRHLSRWFLETDVQFRTHHRSYPKLCILFEQHPVSPWMWQFLAEPW